MENRFEPLVNEIIEEAILWRRELHQNPELSFEEYQTTDYIIENLRKLDNITIEKVADTGIIAILDGAKPGKKIGLRADIDALPINEQTDIDFKSNNEGIMHACGHDVHTAMLLASVNILNDLADELSGQIKFIFQAAEEKQPGGAIEIVKSGIIDDLDYVFSMHVMPTIPVNKVAFKEGAVFTSSDSFVIEIQGKGGHAAMPYLTIDPVITTAEIIMALQTIVSRKINPLKNPIISTTLVNTSGANNIIPDKVTIEGSVRNFNDEIRKETEGWIKQVVNGIAKTHGASANINYNHGYSTVMNDKYCYNVAKKAAESFMKSEDIMILDEPVLASEDFSEFSKVIPGHYALIGSGNPDVNAIFNSHHPKFKVDEDAMYYGIMLTLNTVAQLLIK